ncbi:MAG: HEAT repeat domain-containing protein, partial [Planctomycetaceae bacterium]|nr:HEAT repeat domain-containing protein [Planctomycetaceae bacterium]
IYRDVLLGEEFLNDAFTCEPVHQSVHRIDFLPADGGFAGRRGPGEESREFLSSTDRWFRPVQARTGPDGALWIVDMYRYVIEHSRWIPQASLNDLNVYAGQGRGRIYRVLPKAVNQTAATPSAGQEPRPERGLSLTDLPDDELAKRLDTTNGPTRDLIHQLLLWRNAHGAAGTLRTVTRSAMYPAARFQALAVLNGLGELSEADVLHGLQDGNADVRRFALELAESFLNNSASLQQVVAALTRDPDVRVRRQAALSLGAVSEDSVGTESAGQVLAVLLSNREPNAFVRSAALNSVSAVNVRAVLRAVSELEPQDRNQGSRKQLLTLSLQVGDAETLSDVLTKYLPPTNPLPIGPQADQWIAALAALDSRAARKNLPPDFSVPDSVSRLPDNAVAVLTEKVQVDGVAGEASPGQGAISVDSDNPPGFSNDARSDSGIVAAIQLLGRPFGSLSQSVADAAEQADRLTAAGRVDLLAGFLSARYSAPVRQAAVTGIAGTGAPEAPKRLLASLPSLHGDLRLQVIDSLLNRPQAANELLAAIAAGKIRPDSLDAGRRDKLLSHKDAGVRKSAEDVFGMQLQSNRAAIVESMKGALKRDASADRGRDVSRRRCAGCHRLEDYGHIAGPDLAALTNRDPQWLLTTILDPNKDVDARYLSWTAATTDGLTKSGMIVEETATTIHLREAEGKEHVIRREDIADFTTFQKSLMPEGLERDVTEQDLADVIAYLATFESPPKSVPGNRPRLVRVDDEGVFRMTADTAEIRGTDITFEAPFANIGYWHHRNDSVRWKIESASAGTFDVYINAACANEAAGNTFRLSGTDFVLQGTVAGTGGWDRYRQQKVGTVKLAVGRHQIFLLPAADVRQALFDLKEVRLVPAGKSPGFQMADVTDSPLPRYPPEIAPFLLDESQPVERRQQVIDQRPGMGPGIIALLSSDIRAGDEAEEYRRIPWIWRVAIAVGKRNDGGEIRDLLEVSVPRPGEPLRDWQAVVIGGGLINGATIVGVWPNDRLQEILSGLPDVRAAWPEALRKASEMADSPAVRPGTRYDALRMVALRDHEQAVPHLLRYITEDTPRELQMGAVSGLGDMPSEPAATAMAAALDYLQGRNRQLAIEALLRTDGRTELLQQRLRSGMLTLPEKEQPYFRDHPVKAIRKRFELLQLP